jgi:lipid A disaccharide synthetase
VISTVIDYLNRDIGVSEFSLIGIQTILKDCSTWKVRDAVLQQILTEKHPAWLVRWETHGERVQLTRSIKKRDRDPKYI